MALCWSTEVTWVKPWGTWTNPKGLWVENGCPWVNQWGTWGNLKGVCTSDSRVKHGSRREGMTTDQKVNGALTLSNLRTFDPQRPVCLSSVRAHGCDCSMEDSP